MRKWTKSACVAVALGIGFLVAVVGLFAATGPQGSAHPAQASTTIASSSSGSSSSTSSNSGSRTQAVPAATAGLMTAAASAAAVPAVTWVVRPGETLSGIAAALGVRGGWQALYAANRRVIGADPGLIRPGLVLAVPGVQRPGSYRVAPGDTLSAIAAALGVRGGWPALYAANRRVVGADPGLIRPGMVLAVPGPAASGQVPAVPGPGGYRAPASPPARGGQPHGPGVGGTPAIGGRPAAPGTSGGMQAVPGNASPAGMVPVRGPGGDGIMPRWLKATLLAVGALTVASFLAQAAMAVARRRGIPARGTVGRPGPGRRAAEKAARIVQADHERLIITYSISDDTVYLLTPPGEDPRSVLRAARLVVPEDTYEELADHLGVPSGWQRE